MAIPKIYDNRPTITIKDREGEIRIFENVQIMGIESGIKMKTEPLWATTTIKFTATTKQISILSRIWRRIKREYRTMQARLTLTLTLTRR